ncbi:MAG TPA: SatD family protein [Dermatophilaceae bacterium]|nr:SatD family protein [Dermatophilaceae bacterium]
MSTVQFSGSPCVVIGDIVGSRAATDRAALHRRVESVLRAASAAVPVVQPWAVTVGDEFQGVFPTLGAALEGALRVRLSLLPRVDTRFGVGRGGRTVLDADRGIEDGPAWWAARAALEGGEEGARRPALRLVRTAYRSAEPDPGQEAVNAALACRDHLLGSMSTRSLRLLRGAVLEGATQAQLAESEGISRSAVSQRFRVDGIGVVLDAGERLGGLP